MSIVSGSTVRLLFRREVCGLGHIFKFFYVQFVTHFGNLDKIKLELLHGENKLYLLVLQGSIIDVLKYN